jgi:hypothetical protein
VRAPGAVADDEEEEAKADPLGRYDEGFSLSSVVVPHLG